MTNTTDKQRHWSTPVLLSYNDITYKWLGGRKQWHDTIANSTS
jgi:hypothetical protein